MNGLIITICSIPISSRGGIVISSNLTKINIAWTRILITTRWRAQWPGGGGYSFGSVHTMPYHPIYYMVADRCFQRALLLFSVLHLLGTDDAIVVRIKSTPSRRITSWRTLRSVGQSIKQWALLLPATGSLTKHRLGAR